MALVQAVMNVVVYQRTSDSWHVEICTLVVTDMLSLNTEGSKESDCCTVSNADDVVRDAWESRSVVSQTLKSSTCHNLSRNIIQLSLSY